MGSTDVPPTPVDAGAPIRRPVTALAMAPATAAEMFAAPVRDRLAAVADVKPAVLSTFIDADWKTLSDVEVLLTGWGAPRIDRSVVDRLPALRAIVHSAGSVKPIMDPDAFTPGLVVSSAAAANSIPVAEYTFAAIVMAAKRANRFAAQYRRTGRIRPADHVETEVPWIGADGLTVGVVAASRIGRRVIELLGQLDATVLVHDPYLAADDPITARAHPVGLPELLRRSDIVTLHAPQGPQTRHLLDREKLAWLRDGAVVINTARGSLIDTAALLPHLQSGRLDAILDVTDPEPLPLDSPLFDLPNVTVTPHIAGAMGNELARLADLAIAEIARIAQGQPVLHPVTRADLDRIA